MVKIDKIKEEDVGRAYQFCLSIFEELKWDKSFTYGFENLLKFFSGPGEVFYLAKKEEDIVATAGIKRLSGKEALLKRFYVAQNFRGKGLAQEMMRKIKEFAKDNSYSAVVLDTFQDNTRAKRFFEKQGFSVFDPAPNENWKELQFPEKFEFRRCKI